MKKMISIMAISMALLALAGCTGTIGAEGGKDNDVLREPPQELEGEEITPFPQESDTPVIQIDKLKKTFDEYDAEYIRGTWVEGNFPLCFVVDSREKLEALFAGSDGVRDTAELYADDITLDEFAKYDDEFFEKKFLLIAVTTFTSGSYSQQVDTVGMTPNGDKYLVTLRTVRPQGDVFTGDMALWYVAVALDRDYLTENTDASVMFLK